MLTIRIRSGVPRTQLVRVLTSDLILLQHRRYSLSTKALARLDKLQAEYAALTTQPRGDTYDAQLEKKISKLSSASRLYAEYRAAQNSISELKLMCLDQQLRAAARDELEEVSKSLEVLEKEIHESLVPRHEYHDNTCLIEIRPGIGGSEAALFASDLLRMYRTYLLVRKWDHVVLLSALNSAGGLIEGVLAVREPASFGFFQHEAGVHRVQRVPATETKGRVHTSTAAVVVLPEVSEAEFALDLREVRIDVMRASGSGGQHVNTTESAVRAVHLPTNTIVTCQDERSQHQNKARALEVLRTRLAERSRLEKQRKTQQQRAAQVSSTDRSERIRTYNFPQNRVTDHRSGLSLHHLTEVVNGGMQLTELIESVNVSLRNDSLDS